MPRHNGVRKQLRRLDHWAKPEKTYGTGLIWITSLQTKQNAKPCAHLRGADHAADLCAAIKSDGPISETDKGARAHPAFIIVRQYRASS